MDKAYIAGIDIGTTNIKGAIYSDDGILISSASISYQSYSPEEGFHEQNPDDWVNGFVNVLDKLLMNENIGEIKRNDIRENLVAISISTQGGTLVPVDNDFNPLYKAITWLDRRGEKLLLHDTSLKSRNIWFYKKTGWRLDSGMSFMPLLWLKQNHPELFGKIFKVLYVNDYVQKKITGNLLGNCYQDPSNASITLFFNIKTGEWDNEILSLLDLSKDNFSEVKNPGYFVGYLDREISEKLGIKSKVKIINGSHDQYCVGLGSGVLNKNEILLATGTAWVIFKMLDRPLLDTKRFFSIGRFSVNDKVLVNKNKRANEISNDTNNNINFEDENPSNKDNEFEKFVGMDIDNKFGLIYSIPTGCASLRWFALNILNYASENKLFKLIDKNLDKLAKIKNNVIFHPYLSGTSGPDFDIYRKASFINLELCHNYLDLIKAIMEGVGFQLKKILLILKEKGIDPEEIKMVGGGAKDPIWPQIIADITGFNIFIPRNPSEDFATKGAAILAGYGSGLFSSLEEGYNRLESDFNIIAPDPKNLDFYKEKFKLF